LSTPELQPDLSRLPSLPRDDDGPVFAEPWQAQASAMAIRLSEQGHLTWKEWAAALAEELKAATGDSVPDGGSRYYHQWLAVLEKLAVAKGLSSRNEMSRRKEAWADAYRHTPHGKPVALRESPARTQGVVKGDRRKTGNTLETD